jgi:type I restriction enzyme S subunit
MIEKQKFIATPVGNMPFDWKKYHLSELSEFITKGATPTTYGFEWQDSGITFLRSECVSELGYSESGVAFISKEAHDAMDRSKIKGGDILISITGNVGRIAVYPIDKTEGNINQHIARVRIIKNEIANREFIYYQLNQKNYRNYYLGIITGAAYPQLSLKQIRETSVYLPPLQTQKRIADILSAYDDLIENNLKRIKLLEQAAQNIYKEWFVNLRFPGHENTPTNQQTGLPEGWMKLTIQEYTKVASRGPSLDYKVEKGFPVLNQSCIRNGEIELDKVRIAGKIKENKEHCYLQINDILINSMGQGTLGRVSKNNSINEKFIIHNCITFLRSKDEFSQTLLYHFISSKENYFISISQGSTGQTTLKLSLIKEMEINTPSADLMKLFDNQVLPMWTQIGYLKNQNQKLKAARNILLPRLMNRTIEI